MTTVSLSADLLYFVDDKGTVGSYNTTTGAVSTVGSFNTYLTDIALSGSGQLYASSFSDLSVLNPASGTATSVHSFTGSIASTVNALEFAPDGSLHVDGMTGIHLVLDGTLATQLSSTQTDAPSNGDVVTDAAGNTYVASEGSISLLKADGSSSIAYTTGRYDTYGLAFGKNGDLYAFAGTDLYDINLSTGKMTLVTDLSANGFSNITGATSVNDIASTVGGALTREAAQQIHGSLFVLDSAANIVAGLDNLQSMAAAKEIGAIAFTDGGTPALSVTGAQLSSDGAALADITGNFTLSVTASTPNLTLTGPAGHATTVVFSGSSAQYTVTPAGDGMSLTVTDSGIGQTGTDHLSGIAALKFSDVTEIVAATPGSANAVTTGNVTELYSAVLAREPDVGGLAFYQAYLEAHPSTPLLQFAEWFLSSSEYTAAHNYAQTSAGDTQFITDSYQNLLNRAPLAADVDFYLTNVMQKAVAGLTPGTQAYTNAEFQAHAQMLVYFSASPEFLTDVQVTSQHPASAQHWLLLI